MRIAIGADHGGFVLKQQLVQWMAAHGHEVLDMGTHSSASCDYPRMGAQVALAVARRKAARGVLLCKSGIGMAMAANKVPGVRAAHCRDVHDARSSREHNNANVLVLGAQRVSAQQAQRALSTWLKTSFDARSRHARRVRQITQLERRMKT